MVRMSQVEVADNLGKLRVPQPGRFHELSADKSGWLACDLNGNYRLVFEVANEPVPVLESGGLDWSKVTHIRILGVIDYHEHSKRQPV